MRIRGFRKKMYCIAYDKPGIQKMALRFKHSLDEVKQLLRGKQKKK